MSAEPSAKIVPRLIKLQKECGGYLPQERMRDLAEELEVPLYRLQAVASFFSHFRFDPPPRVEVLVCRDMACHMAGAESLCDGLESLAAEIGGKQIHIAGTSCLGRCDQPVAISINDRYYCGRDEFEIADLVRAAMDREASIDRNHRADAGSLKPTGWNIDPYDGEPRFTVLKSLLQADDFEAAREKFLKSIEESGLVGKGGPGAGPVKKWRAVINAPGKTKYVVCNADESEPGTFKDRELMLRVPHLVVEGVLIACAVLDAEKGYIYVRHEYPEQVKMLERAIAQAKAIGLKRKRPDGSELRFDVDVFVSPGNYICGEQSALIEVIEGKRAEPRQRPPDLEIQGLFGKPTLVNNVETLAWIPSIITRGGKWYADLGINGAKGMRYSSISGDVKNPGVYEVPLGITVGELLDLCGGMAGGDTFKAFAPSGPSGGFLPRYIPRDKLPASFVQSVLSAEEKAYDLFKLPLDNNYFRYQLKGTMMLGAAHVFYGSRRRLLDEAINNTEFYRNESCGKCVPCRMGCQKLVEIGHHHLSGPNAPEMIDLVEELGEVMSSSSICGLGQVAANPLLSLIEFFPDEAVRRGSSFQSV
ncbi:NAD(P)H-dependent oxidoreductase subunit E [bacterium]|nr:NAD(P)H-dependent oxidoreductase subunit E [bacterium]